MHPVTVLKAQLELHCCFTTSLPITVLVPFTTFTCVFPSKKWLQLPQDGIWKIDVGFNIVQRSCDLPIQHMDLWQILDAYVRRPPGATRTIGTLLGWISLDAQTSGAQCWRNMDSMDGEVWGVPQSSWYFLINRWSSLPSSLSRLLFFYPPKGLRLDLKRLEQFWWGEGSAVDITDSFPVPHKAAWLQVRLSCWQQKPLTFKIRVRNARRSVGRVTGRLK